MKLAIFDLDETLYDKSGQLGESISIDKAKKITPFPDTREVLDKLDFTKILVTKAMHGEEIANVKIDALKIRKFFDKIIMTKDNPSKKTAFKNIINEYKVKEKCNCFVIGDRIDSEIRYGNELGLRTILIKRGKYKDLKARDEFEIPDYTITDLREILDIINK
jgi:putative hydrolase of the HAD superfamily